MKDGHRILLVEDHPVLRKQLELILRKAGFDVIAAENGRRALDIFRETPCPIIVTDWMMPEMDGIELCRTLRDTRAPDGYVYILLLTSRNSKDDIVAGLEAGADDFVGKPYHPAELIARLNTAKRVIGLERCLKRINEETRILSITDPLTGAYNRSYLKDRLPQEVARAQKYSRALSIILGDLDHFKKINDAHGHLAGDEALKSFVDRIRRVIRTDCDWIARFGGDEFLVVLPETSPAGARTAAERYARLIAESPVDVRGERIRLSATFGVTGFDRSPGEQHASPEALIVRADECLYRAKRDHRGSVVVEAWEPDPLYADPLRARTA
jgi:two-component system cell cycle response regulator